MEIERKWLIEIKDIPYDLSKYESWEIEQAYISFSPTIRIRKIVNQNLGFLTIKSQSVDNGISREEFEFPISINQYNDLLKKKEGITLYKTRYLIPLNDLTLEIDIFHNDYEGLAYLEIEFDSVDQAKNFNTPDWIKKEVTNIGSYNNSSLARKKNI